MYIQIMGESQYDKSYRRDITRMNIRQKIDGAAVEVFVTFQANQVIQFVKSMTP